MNYFTLQSYELLEISSKSLAHIGKYHYFCIVYLCFILNGTSYDTSKRILFYRPVGQD